VDDRSEPQTRNVLTLIVDPSDDEQATAKPRSALHSRKQQSRIVSSPEASFAMAPPQVGEAGIHL
jgi:hypothetical protein